MAEVDLNRPIDFLGKVIRIKGGKDSSYNFTIYERDGRDGSISNELGGGSGMPTAERALDLAKFFCREPHIFATWKKGSSDDR